MEIHCRGMVRFAVIATVFNIKEQGEKMKQAIQGIPRGIKNLNLVAAHMVLYGRVSSLLSNGGGLSPREVPRTDSICLHARQDVEGPGPVNVALSPRRPKKRKTRRPLPPTPPC